MLAGMKVTIALTDDALYTSVKVRAAVSGRAIRDIVEEALAMWLERAEDEEDLRASADALEEYRITGGVEADAYFQRLVAEGRVTYDADPT